MKQVNAMTDEELQQAGISQEWVSGTAPSEWPYFEKDGTPIPATAADRANEK